MGETSREKKTSFALHYCHTYSLTFLKDALPYLSQNDYFKRKGFAFKENRKRMNSSLLLRHFDRFASLSGAMSTADFAF